MLTSVLCKLCTTIKHRIVSYKLKFVQHGFWCAMVKNEALVLILALHKESRIVIKQYRLAEICLAYVEEKGKHFQCR